jgi:hypothetical protein
VEVLGAGAVLVSSSDAATEAATKAGAGAVFCLFIGELFSLSPPSSSSSSSILVLLRAAICAAEGFGGASASSDSSSAL